MVLIIASGKSMNGLSYGETYISYKDECLAEKPTQECKNCTYNTLCKLAVRLEHIEDIHYVRRFFIDNPELLRPKSDYLFDNSRC